MYSKETLTKMYRTLYAIRTFETRCIKLYRQGLIRGYFHPYLGEEAIATGVCAALEERDYIVSTHRGHGHCIARGAEIKKMLAELLGKAAGYCNGRGGSMHIADFSTNNLGANGIVGAGIPLGVGAALGAKIRGEDRVAAIFFSDGAANNGVFAEAMNLAAIWDLAVILVLENNHYAVSTPIEQVSRSADLYKRGLGYGVESFAVDGNDILEVYQKTAAAAAKCRDGKGPILMEAKTYRHTGHHVNDPGQYMPKETLDYYKSKDPVKIGRNYLLKEAKASPEEVKRIEAAVEQELEEAVQFAVDSPAPSVEEFLLEVENA
ncbi:MAG: thiamine pyrophosphate-dependent dehydrogenase E1 component subunit alpha [Planctomycetota bacterium]|nr:thiamine pyrophosphate-dependent dehydrogenase E1 component subunit alpha [Planctomycetota bacterium]